MELVLHPNTKKLIEEVVLNPPPVVCLLAPPGSGRGSIAELIAQRILKDQIITPANLHIVRPSENGPSTIKDIREITSFLKLKTVSDSNINRVVIIEHIDQLSIESQNTLLKTFEEPPLDTIIIATASQPNLILKTVLSRIRLAEIMPPTKQQIIDYFKTHSSINKLEKYWHISAGRIGLLFSLVENNDHSLLLYIDEVKQLVSSTLYGRLLLIDKLSRLEMNHVLEALMLVINARLRSAINHNDKATIHKMNCIQSLIYAHQTNVASHPNAKLTLLNIALAM